MHFTSLITALLATVPIVTSAPADPSAGGDNLHLTKNRDLDNNTDNGDPHLMRDLTERSVGRLQFPMWLGILPKGLTFTVDEDKKIIPDGMEAWYSGPQIPHTVYADQVEEKAKKNGAGVFLGHFYMQSPGLFHGGQGASHQIKFTIAGHNTEGAKIQPVKGILTIATSPWGKISRPDNYFFSWIIEGSDGNFSDAVPTLIPLADQIVAIVYNAVTKQYQFTVATKGALTQKVSEMAVNGIISGHEFIWNSVAAATGLSLVMTVASWIPKLLN